MAVVTTIYKDHHFQQNVSGLLFQVNRLNIDHNNFTLPKLIMLKLIIFPYSL